MKTENKSTKLIFHEYTRRSARLLIASKPPSAGFSADIKIVNKKKIYRMEFYNNLIGFYINLVPWYGWVRRLHRKV